MWFCWFLACCLAARQNESKTIKKRVKKYGLEELKRELEALGVNIDENVDETKMKNKKKTKKELQKLLIKELKRVEHGKTGLDNRAYEDGFTMPEEVISVLNDLDMFLDKQLEEQERNEQRDNDVKAVLGGILDKVDSALASEGLNEKEETEKEKALRPEAGDRKEEAERAAQFWSATQNHKGSVPRRRFRVARRSSRRLTM
ncbi:hypothetical protein AALO_G00223580 [Alosa alosa]|uniref:Uncharacterized protein n=1 Tax=Alosa alosa TaxID=278164 RepID=A0AAV6FXL8_9TELE|nr:uncharacterized protein LOC125310517 [Alosa alosa]KAG5267603.1 hypothetical protein AALO_G00223580 [Alosa alosa]